MQSTPVQILRDVRWPTVGMVPWPGAAQERHGEGGGDGVERRGGGAPAGGPEASDWPAVFFGGSEGGKRLNISVFWFE